MVKYYDFGDRCPEFKFWLLQLLCELEQTSELFVQNGEDNNSIYLQELLWKLR